MKLGAKTALGVEISEGLINLALLRQSAEGIELVGTASGEVPDGAIEDGRVAEKAWFMIKETSGVGDFIGTEGIPSPMRDTDVAKMLLEAEKPEEAPSIKVEFKKGDQIKIREGAFENFEGTVDSIDPERGIVKVIVTIFGRSTPLDIEYWQIEKL